MKIHTLAQLGEEVMSSWGEYSFLAEPVFAHEFQDAIRLITKDATSYSISTFLNRDAPTTTITIDPALDLREQPSGSPAVTYHESLNWTEFRHTGRDASLAATMLVTNHDSGGEGGGRFLTPRHVGPHDDLGGTDSSAFFWGRLDNNGDHWLGFIYTAFLVISDFWVRDSAKRPVIQFLYVLHQESTDYELKIEVDGRSGSETFNWQAAVTGATVIGQPSFDTGFSKHLSLDDPRNLQLTLQSSTPGSMIISSLEYDLTIKGKS